MKGGLSRAGRYTAGARAHAGNTPRYTGIHGRTGRRLDSENKKGMWVKAIVLIVLSATGYLLAAAYARSYMPAQQQLADSDPSAPQGPPPAGAPTREQVAQLHDALRAKFGSNARGLSRVTHLDYDGWPDRMHVVVALDHNITTMTPQQAVELAPVLDIVRAIRESGLHWRWILVSATAPVEGPGKKFAEESVVRAVISREKLDRADWKNLTAAGLTAMAEQFTVDPSLSGLRRSVLGNDDPARPQTRPALTSPAGSPANAHPSPKMPATDDLPAAEDPDDEYDKPVDR